MAEWVQVGKAAEIRSGGREVFDLGYGLFVAVFNVGGTYYAITWIMNADDSDGLAYGASEWFEVKNRVPGREAHIAVYEPNRAWVQNAHAVIPQSSRQA